jgi:hypothetical protein
VSFTDIVFPAGLILPAFILRMPATGRRKREGGEPGRKREGVGKVKKEGEKRKRNIESTR